MKLELKQYWTNLINKSVTKFFILSALYDKECYGYELAFLVASNSFGTCSPSFGTIYPTLSELLRGKYVEKQEVAVGKRKRKVYYLTEKGKKAYRAALAAFGEHITLLSNICMRDLNKLGKG